jgi:hypothetical protein
MELEGKKTLENVNGIRRKENYKKCSDQQNKLFFFMYFQNHIFYQM